MSIQFGGIGSGLPVNDWINAIMQSESTRLNALQAQKTSMQTSKTALSTLESKFSLLRSSIEDLTDANIASAFDLFKRKSVSSSDEDIATASVSDKATIQKIDLQVESLATSTTATSQSDVGKVIDTGDEAFTDLSNGDAEAGTFSIYAGGVKHEFTITDGESLNDIRTNIEGAGITSLSTTIVNGKLVLSYDQTQSGEIKLGSSSDTSNFFNVMNLSTADPVNVSGDQYTLSSSTAVNTVDINGTIVGNTANLAGTLDQASYTFKIGGSEFTIDSNTTLQDVINNINSDDNAGVTANYDTRLNKIVLTAKDPGGTAINLEDTSGDFLQQMGLITAGGDSLSSQTLGANAVVYINDPDKNNPIEVNSNTLTADMTGLTGVTINLKNITDMAANETVSFNVDQDTGQLTTAVKDFIDKFNTVISQVDSQTASGQSLAGEYSLVSVRNSLRMLATGRVNGLSSYDSLGMIGISTGKVGTSVNDSTKTLQLDESKFLEALQNNPDEVKALLVGDSDKGITGILQLLGDRVENVVDPTNGYFTAREDSMNSQMTSLDKSITREQDRLDARQTQLTNQFNQMDQYISQMQQQSQALAGL